MDKELSDKLTEFGTLTKALHDTVERQDTEMKKLGVSMPETKAMLDKLTARLDQVEEKLQRPPAKSGEGHEEKTGKETPEYKAFAKYVRQGKDALTIEEQKTLSVGDDTAGGYLVIPQIQNEIIRILTLISPIRSIARVVPISTAVLVFPKQTAVLSGGWTSESGTRTESTGTAFGKVDIQAHEMYAMPYATRQLIEDNAFNLESYLQDEAALQLAKLEGAGFVSGTDVGQPEGLLTNGDIDYTAQGEASTLTNADGLIKLIHDVPTFYANGGKFILNRATLGLIRTLKDGDGRYIWQPDYTGNNPALILGYPYVETPDMPSVTTNTYPVMFGNFAMAYVIADRMAISMLRDPYSAKKSGVIEYYFYKRVGGKVVLPAAVRKLKIAAA